MGVKATASRSRSSRRTSATSATTSRPSQSRDAPDVIIGAHDWTGQLAADGLVLPLFPKQATLGAVPDVRARRVLVRHRGQAPLRRARRARERRPRREHEARQGADDVRAAREAGARLQEEEQRQPRHRRPAGRRPATRTTCTRSSPVSAATSSARTRRATSTRRDIGVANKTFLKNAAMIDTLEQVGPDQLEDRLRHRQERVPQGQGGLLGHRPVGVDTLKTEQSALPDRPGAGDQVQARCRSSASRASWSRSYAQRRTGSRARRRTSSAAT